MTLSVQRSAEQSASVAFADRLIEELEAADTIVLAVPMYNFSIPSTLKAWIDHVARAGRTFRYTAAGPEGLLKGKKVFVITGRGGFTAATARRKCSTFRSRTAWRPRVPRPHRCDFIHVEGLKVSPEAAEQAIKGARETITAIAGIPKRRLRSRGFPL